MSKKLLRLMTAVCLIAMACFVFTGCGSDNKSAGSGDAKGKVLTYASPDYTTINSILNTHDELPDIIFSGLMKYDGKGLGFLSGDEFDEASKEFESRLITIVADGQEFSAYELL